MFSNEDIEKNRVFLQHMNRNTG